MCPVNIPVIFSGKPVGFEEFLIRIVEALEVFL